LLAGYSHGLGELVIHLKTCPSNTTTNCLGHRTTNKKQHDKQQTTNKTTETDNKRQTTSNTTNNKQQATSSTTNKQKDKPASTNTKYTRDNKKEKKTTNHQKPKRNK
jgi:hypothetical protein